MVKSKTKLPKKERDKMSNNTNIAIYNSPFFCSAMELFYFIILSLIFFTGKLLSFIRVSM